MREYVRVWIVSGLGLAALGMIGFTGFGLMERHYLSKNKIIIDMNYSPVWRKSSFYRRADEMQIYHHRDEERAVIYSSLKEFMEINHITSLEDSRIVIKR